MRNLAICFASLALLGMLINACAPAASTSISTPTIAAVAPTAAAAPTQASSASTPAKAPAVPTEAAAKTQAASAPSQKVDVPIEKMTIRYGASPAAAHAPVFVAIEKGYFKERGLDVQIDDAVGMENIAMVTTGELKLAAEGPGAPTFNAIQQKLPVVMIAAASSTSSPTATESSHQLVVRKDLYDKGTVKSVKDLKGRKVSFLGPGGPSQFSLYMALKAAGLTLKDIDATNMDFPTAAAALSNGAIDAAILPEPWPTQVVSKGIAMRLAADVNVGSQTSIILVDPKTVKEHPNAMTNFLIAFLKGARDLYGNGWRDPSNVKIIEKYTKIPADVIMQMALPYTDPNGKINEKSVDGIQQFCIENGYTKYTTPMPVSGMIDYTILNRAIEFLGEFKGQ